MVLTRAQRAQTTTTGSDAPPAAGLSKAPARRGRAKKAEPAKEEKPAVKAPAKTTRVTKAAVAKKEETEGKEVEEVKKPVARSRTATGTTKASAARAAAAPKAAPVKTTTRAAAKKASSSKAANAKPVTERKAVPAAKATRATKSAKAIAPPEPAQEKHEELEAQDEAAAELSEVVNEPEEAEVEVEEGEDLEVEDAQEPEKECMKTIIVQTKSQEACKADEQSTTTALPTLVSTSMGPPASPTKLPRPVTATEAPSSMTGPSASPSKLPQPVAATENPVSPFKSSLLSSTQGLGSVRKPAVPNTLFTSPAKPTTVLQSATKPALPATSPVRLNTSIKDFAAVLGSPRRPGSSGSDDSAAGSRASTPKRPHTSEETALHISPKRLRTSMSMPSLASQSSTSGSPPSPAKSSLRSPEKRPNMSPKKVSWHQTPPRQQVACVQETTPPPREPGILDGCVFFLDVNSLTGSNQNGLFAGLIEELGGQCVQVWSHNNMGITHVLFMNGEMRTLEKVLASNGDVFCVSLGWLLDCQREQLRIPENQPRYLIDLTHVPGHTPKPNRSALNTPMTARSTAPVSHTPALPPPKWALPTTPSIPREPLGALSSSLLIKTPAFLASKHTPGPPPSVGMGTIDEREDKENVSPSVASEATPLMQKTCPPKQLNKSILAMSTGISATPLRNKFLASRQQQRRRSFDGGVKTMGLGSPPRKMVGLGSPKRKGSPVKRGLFAA